MKVLGLDLSLTNSGIVLLEDGVATERYLVQTNSDVTDMDRYAYIAGSVMGQVIDQTLAEMRVDLVAMEGVYASRNLLTFGRLTALSSIVQFALYRSRIPYTVIHALEWRKILFGPGSKVDKERVRVACAQRLKEHLGTVDVEKVDLNVLEALCVGLAAYNRILDPSLGSHKPVRRATRRKVATEG
jgi:Holliday junction resolvasome RuvABC endonuclease subunit